VNCYRLRHIAVLGKAYREIASGPDRHGQQGKNSNRDFWGLLALPVMDSTRALPAGNYSSRGHVIIAARSALVFFVRRICKTATIFRLTRVILSSAYDGGPIMRLPGNARLGSTLYFKSPSLGEIMFIDVDITPDDDSEIELLPEGRCRTH
jgi:hypothetical protein